LLDSVEAGFATDEPDGCAYGADGKMAAAGCAMAELEAFTSAEEVDRMLAGVVAATQGLDADCLRGAGSRFAGALENETICEFPALSLGDGFCKKKRGPAWCVSLFRVMKFEEFGIVAIAE
jgi:hypothetical protein